MSDPPQKTEVREKSVVSDVYSFRGILTNEVIERILFFTDDPRAVMRSFFNGLSNKDDAIELVKIYRSFLNHRFFQIQKALSVSLEPSLDASLERIQEFRSGTEALVRSVSENLNIPVTQRVETLFNSKGILNVLEARQLESCSSFASLAKTIKSYSDDQVPYDIKVILEGWDIEAIAQLENFVGARDTLEVWQQIIRQATRQRIPDLQEDFNRVWQSSDAVIAKAESFTGWVEANQKNLAKVDRLRLNNIQLSTVPRELGKFSNLRVLRLEANQLTSVPEELGNLSQLQELWLNHNQLTKVPKELGKLVKLKYLYLFDNQLAEVPEELGKLTELEDIYLEGNPLFSVSTCLN